MKHEHFWVMCAAAGTALALMVGAAGAAIAAPQRTAVATVVGERLEDGLSTRVSYADLNLASARDERILNRRVAGAARDVCDPHLSYGPRDFGGCMSYAWRGAKPQIALAVKRAHEIARNGTSSIPAVAISIAVR